MHSHLQYFSNGQMAVAVTKQPISRHQNVIWVLLKSEGCMLDATPPVSSWGLSTSNQWEKPTEIFIFC